MSSPPPAIVFSTSSMNKPNRAAWMRHATYEGCRSERGRGQQFGHSLGLVTSRKMKFIHWLNEEEVGRKRGEHGG